MLVWRHVMEGFGIHSHALMRKQRSNLTKKTPSDNKTTNPFYNPSSNPIPLSAEHISMIRNNSHGYVVSEKTDGVRCLLYIGRRANTSRPSKQKTTELRPIADFIDRQFVRYKVLLQKHKSIHQTWCGISSDYNANTITPDSSSSSSSSTSSSPDVNSQDTLASKSCNDMDTDDNEPVHGMDNDASSNMGPPPSRPQQQQQQCWFLLDGEFVKKYPQEQSTNTDATAAAAATTSTATTTNEYVFMVFDVIVAHGQSQSHKNLYDRRRVFETVLRETPFPTISRKSEATGTSMSWRLELKKIYHPSRALALWQHVSGEKVNNQQFAPVHHDSDGLIFTPISTQVAARKHIHELYHSGSSSGGGGIDGGSNNTQKRSSTSTITLATFKYKPITTLDASLHWKRTEAVAPCQWHIGISLAEDRYVHAYQDHCLLPLIMLQAIDWQRLYHLPATPHLVMTEKLVSFLETKPMQGKCIVECSVNVYDGQWVFEKERPDKQQPNPTTVCVDTLRSMLRPVLLEDLSLETRDAQTSRDNGQIKKL